MPGGNAKIKSVCNPGADAPYVYLAADPENDGAKGPSSEGY